jgi:hypothetical protein
MLASAAGVELPAPTPMRAMSVASQCTAPKVVTHLNELKRKYTRILRWLRFLDIVSDTLFVQVWTASA